MVEAALSSDSELRDAVTDAWDKYANRRLFEAAAAFDPRNLGVAKSARVEKKFHLEDTSKLFPQLAQHDEYLQKYRGLPVCSLLSVANPIKYWEKEAEEGSAAAGVILEVLCVP
eukprot:Sspe_Gene.87394::Locus_58592_Transcript_1_1_Confidence_1.000_Length_814::g.87394::m.87394